MPHAGALRPEGIVGVKQFAYGCIAARFEAFGFEGLKRKGRKLNRDFVSEIHNGLKALCANRFHEGREDGIKRIPLLRRQTVKDFSGLERGAEQDFLRNQRGDSRKGGRKCTVQRERALRGEGSGKIRLKEFERVGFLKLFRDKIRTPRQHFAERTHTCGDAAHAVQDDIILIGKDDIRVLAHELRIQCTRRDVSELIELRGFNADDAFQPELFHGSYLSGADVLSQ